MTTAQLPDPAAQPRRGPSLALKFALAFLMGAVLVVGVGGGALYAYGQQYTGKVLPGVSVGQTDLSGLTPEQARTAVAAAYASLAAGAITLSGPNGDLTVGYGEIGRKPDVDAIVTAAMAAGREGQPVAELLGAPQTALRGVTLGPAVTYNQAKLVEAIDAVAKTIDRAPVDATLVAEDGNFLLTESVDGRTVDREALLRSIDAQVAKLETPAAIRAEIPYTTQVPAVETADAQAAKAAGERMGADLVLTRGDTSWTIKGAQLRKLISFSPTADGSITTIVDQDGIKPLLKKMGTDLDRPAANAGFKVKNGRVVVAKSSRDGRKLDKTATVAAILDALMARQAGQPDTELAPVVVGKEPSVTTAQAKAIAPKMREISHWTTWFPIWSHNAFGANIWIPASIINGYVVGPGETFDFWKVVGEVNRAKGYGLGGAIINGRTQAQGAIGGGICSCSTTLFNAALRAGYKMGARKNHYYYIDRYPVGLDATVFISDGGSKQTMSWTNDTKYPVLIRGINTRANGKGYVTFKLYSVPTKRKVSISAPTIKNVRQAGDSTERSSILRKGYSGRLEYPVDGMDVWRTVTVREGSKVIRRTTYYSHYSVITGVVIIGTGGPSAPTSLP